jgi:hypothetical protein
MGRMTWIDMRLHVGAGWGEDIAVLTRRSGKYEKITLFMTLLDWKGPPFQCSPLLIHVTFPM